MDELGNGRTNPVCFRDFDIPQTEFPEKSDLIESVFPNFRNALSTSFTLRAILATLNETVDEYNGQRVRCSQFARGGNNPQISRQRTK